MSFKLNCTTFVTHDCIQNEISKNSSHFTDSSSTRLTPVPNTSGNAIVSIGNFILNAIRVGSVVNWSARFVYIYPAGGAGEIFQVDLDMKNMFGITSFNDDAVTGQGTTTGPQADPAVAGGPPVVAGHVFGDGSSGLVRLYWERDASTGVIGQRASFSGTFVVSE